MIVFLLRLSVSWLSRNHSCIGCVFRMSATRSSACCVENPFVYQLHAENARFQSRFVLSRGSFEVAAFQKRFYSIHPCAVFCEYFLWDIWNYLDTSLISLAVWGGTTSDNMSTIWRGGVNHDNSVPGQILEGQLSSVELSWAQVELMCGLALDQYYSAIAADAVPTIRCAGWNAFKHCIGKPPWLQFTP